MNCQYQEYILCRVATNLANLEKSGNFIVGRRVRIVKNELGGSATQQELRGWGLGVTME